MDINNAIPSMDTIGKLFINAGISYGICQYMGKYVRVLKPEHAALFSALYITAARLGAFVRYQITTSSEGIKAIAGRLLEASIKYGLPALALRHFGAHESIMAAIGVATVAASILYVLFDNDAAVRSWSKA